jgi:hypothetical protein
MQCFLPQDEKAGKPEANNHVPAWRASWKDLGVQSGTAEKDGTLFNFHRTQQPGVYLFELTPRPDAKTSSRDTANETWRAVAYNVEPQRESDLRRTGKSQLERFGSLYGVDSGQPVVEPDKRTDLSENPWFYLVFLAILLAEQALAVRLSYHLRGTELTVPARPMTRTQAA